MTAAKTEAQKLIESLDPATVDRIAEEIQQISAAAKTLLASRLNRDAIALLVSAATWRPKVEKRTVLQVLDAAANLGNAFLRPEPPQQNRPPPTSIPPSGRRGG